MFANIMERRIYLERFPSKRIVDYTSEMDKLFPRTNENDIHQTYNMTAQSLFNHSLVNRSSSSADSTSPESYLEFLTFVPEYRSGIAKLVFGSARPVSDTSRPIYDTPRTVYDSPRQFNDSHRAVYDSPGLSDNFKPCEFDRLIHRTPRPISETPRPDHTFIRKRPIMGRKLMTNPDSFPESAVSIPITNIPDEFEFSPSIWHDDGLFQRTPPNNSFMEPRYNKLYELFPAENRGYEFRTPVKSPNNVSPTCSNISPSISNVSPSLSNLSPNLNLGSSMQSFNVSPPCANAIAIPKPLGSPVPSSSSMNSQDIQPGKMCTFCRKNGETPIVYMTHSVRERVKNKSIVSCPILRSHVCSTCGGTGDDAHTITYCPVLRRNNNGRPLESTTITLKSTRIKSNGRRRY